MDIGDIMYSNVCTQTLLVMVRRGDGQYWDFAAKAFAPATKPIDKAKFCLQLTPDPIFPTTQRCVVPVAATEDPLSELIEATLPGSGIPNPSQSFWVGGGGGTPFNRATGCLVRFTG